MSMMSTFRMGCKAEIKLVTSGDGQSLVVKSANELHNHEINPELFRNLFQQRKLDEQDKETISNMLKVKANKKMIQNQIMTDTGKVVLLKDIHNIKAQAQTSSNNDMSTLQNAVEHFSKANGAYVKLVTSDSNELRGLFFQDKRMRETFDSYPELLCIDATYKVNDLRMPLYILLIENGNGQSEIVGVWLVADETEEMITEMVRLFKDQNPKWTRVKTVMSDKDFVEREVFSKELPDAALRICLFHVLRTFRREVTAEKMGVSRSEREKVLEIIQKIAYSRSEHTYETLKNELTALDLNAVNEYFSRSWDLIKDQWVIGLSPVSSFGNRTNNRLESINQKIKQVVDKNAKFDTFARDFMVFLDGHRTEIKGKACKSTSKVPVTQSSENTPDYEYRRTLTPYAYKIVQKQLGKHETIIINVEGDTAICDNHTVTFNSCECSYYKQYQLPCCHIFAFRSKSEMSLFDSDLIPERWSKKHYVGSLGEYESAVHVERSFKSPASRPITQQQRYRKAFHVAQKLASCAAESTGAVYDVKLRQLHELLRAWECDENVVVTNVNEIDNNDNNAPVDVERETEIDVINHDESESNENEQINIVGDNQSELQENESELDHNTLHNENEMNQNENVQLMQQNEQLEENAFEMNSDTVDNENEMNQTENVQLEQELNETEAIINRNESAEPTEKENVKMNTISEEINEIENETIRSNSNATVLQDISEITLPPNIKKRGRPKGSELTVIGIQRKRLKLKRKKVSFEQLNSYEQAKVVLKWFIDTDNVDERLRANTEITANELTCTSEDIHMAATEIDLEPFKKHFSSDAWEKLLSIVQKAKVRKWACSSCGENLDTRCVGCDGCLGWQHYHCAEITSAPKSKFWFCKQCA